MNTCLMCTNLTKQKRNKLCSVECRGKWLAKIHKGRRLNTGRTHFKKGQPSNNYIGFQRTEKGYIIIHKPDWPSANKRGYVREHRYVMEQHLGRSLLPTEDIHHLNHVRTDNRLENLEVLTHSEHSKLHHLDRMRGLHESLA